jgi:hypothetical protein
MTSPDHPDPGADMPDRSSTPDAPGRDAPLDDDWEPAIDDDDDDGGGAAPRARSRRKLVTPLTVGLCGLLLATAGFIVGVQVQKGQQGSGGGGGGGGGGAAAAGAGGRAAFARAGGAGGGRGGFGGGAGAAGGAAGAGAAAGAGGTTGAAAANAPTIGSVANKKGSTLYVTNTDGTTVKVRTNAQSKVTRNAAASPKGIYPGDTVVVQGTKDKNGNLVATQITATSKTAAASGGGGFGGLRQAFGGGGGGAAGGGGTTGAG